MFWKPWPVTGHIATALLKSIMSFMTNEVKNGISLITIPVPIVCVFKGCVISSCWYFAQVLLTILITACPISTFFCALWSTEDRCRRHVFLFQQPSGPEKKFAFFWRADGERMGSGWGGAGGYHLTFRRTEGVITRNWEPLKKKSLKKNQGNWIQKDVSNLLDKASFSAYKINASILLGGKSVCSLNLL